MQPASVISHLFDLGRPNSNRLFRKSHANCSLIKYKFSGARAMGQLVYSLQASMRIGAPSTHVKSEVQRHALIITVLERWKWESPKASQSNPISEATGLETLKNIVER